MHKKYLTKFYAQQTKNTGRLPAHDKEHLQKSTAHIIFNKEKLDVFPIK
jgi:hypothetical protein